MRLIIHNAWTALALSPAFGVAITLICYQLGCCLQRYARRNPLCNPVLFAIASVIAVLLLTGTDYQTYFTTAAWLHFLLGPATVALAIPLYKNIGEIGERRWQSAPRSPPEPLWRAAARWLSPGAWEHRPRSSVQSHRSP